VLFLVGFRHVVAKSVVFSVCDEMGDLWEYRRVSGGFGIEVQSRRSAADVRIGID
jgi:hypothetical protein